MAKKKKTAERDVKKLTNENKATTNLEQYILNKNLDKIVRYQESNQHLFNYQTFRQINGNGTQIISKLRGIEDLSLFYKIKQSALSLMQPKIKLYKVYHTEYKRRVDGSIDTSVPPATLSTPCYKEIKFSDSFGQETAASVSDYLSYETTKPTFRNVGLKSFSWTWDGRNHGIIENNIDCKLDLIFKSLKDFNASVPGEPNVRYVDLFLWPGAVFDRSTERVSPKHYEIKALVGHAAPSPEQLSGLNLSREDITNISTIEKLNIIFSLTLYDYKIDIKENGTVAVSLTYRGRLETVTGTNQVSVFQSTNRINRSGSEKTSYSVNSDVSYSRVVELTDKIRAMFSGLNDAGCVDATCKSRKQFIEMLKTDSFFREIYLAAKGPHVKVAQGGKVQIKNANHNNIFDWFTELDKKTKTSNADVMNAILFKKIGLFKKQSYQSFTEQLLDGNDSDPGTSPGTRLFCYNAARSTVLEAIGHSSTLKDYDLDPRTKAAVKKAAEDPQPGKDKVGRCDEIKPITKKLKEQVAAELNSYERTQQDRATSNRKGKKKEDKTKKPTFNFDSKNYPFHFIFLGDLFELACKNGGLARLNLGNPEDMPIFTPDSYVKEQNADKEYPLKNARMLLGPMEYLDEKGQIKTINLAQYPISFKYFRAWFFQYVVRRKRIQMPLGTFLSLLIRDLALPAMGLGQKNSIRAPRTLSNVAALALPGKQIAGGVTKTVCGDKLGNMQELLPLQKIINVDSAEFRQNYFKKAQFPMSSETLIKTSYDYLYFYISTARDMLTRKGNAVEDIRDGIYHFNIGSDMGLLKKMNFKKVGMTYLAEYRSEIAEDGGEDQISQLKFPHNTDATLFGTALFSPGMFFYVNPGLAGIGSPEDANSLASQLNIGGYQIIQIVRCSISPGKFETVLVGEQTV